MKDLHTHREIRLIEVIGDVPPNLAVFSPFLAPQRGRSPVRRRARGRLDEDKSARAVLEILW